MDFKKIFESLKEIAGERKNRGRTLAAIGIGGDIAKGTATKKVTKKIVKKPSKGITTENKYPRGGK